MGIVVAVNSDFDLVDRWLLLLLLVMSLALLMDGTMGYCALVSSAVEFQLRGETR